MAAAPQMQDRSDLVRVGAHGQPERARQAKVGQLQRIILPVYQQVLRLQVAVQHPACAGSFFSVVLGPLLACSLHLLRLTEPQVRKWYTCYVLQMHWPCLSTCPTRTTE